MKTVLCKLSGFIKRETVLAAALLLSGFSSNFPALITGTNLGGLGTLIAPWQALSPSSR